MKMKNLINLYFIPHVTFSFNFFHAVTLFYMFSTLMSLEEILRLKLKCMAIMLEPPMAIPIYTVLPYCVIIMRQTAQPLWVPRWGSLRLAPIIFADYRHSAFLEEMRTKDVEFYGSDSAGAESTHIVLCIGGVDGW